MIEKSPNVLSLGINRQRVGIAIFSNGELEYVTGRALPQAGSRNGRRALVDDLDKLVRDHNIGIITMPRLTVQQKHSRAVSRVYQSAQSRAIRAGLTLVVSGTSLRVPRGMKTEENLAVLYPELRRYLGDAAWERRYYRHIFKAVSTGVVLLSIIDCERRSDER